MRPLYFFKLYNKYYWVLIASLKLLSSSYSFQDLSFRGTKAVNFNLEGPLKHSDYIQWHVHVCAFFCILMGEVFNVHLRNPRNPLIRGVSVRISEYKIVSNKQAKGYTTTVSCSNILKTSFRIIGKFKGEENTPQHYVIKNIVKPFGCSSTYKNNNLLLKNQ